MEEHPAERKILIVLSDVKPNDIVKIRYEGQDLAYSGKAAVENCAEELRQARGKGITPLCVYTGDEAGIADVQRTELREDQFAEPLCGGCGETSGRGALESCLARRSFRRIWFRRRSR